MITLFIKVKWFSSIRVQSHNLFQPHRLFNIPRGNPEKPKKFGKSRTYLIKLNTEYIGKKTHYLND